jgi:hypothetical protein
MSIEKEHIEPANSARKGEMERNLNLAGSFSGTREMERDALLASGFYGSLKQPQFMSSISPDDLKPLSVSITEDETLPEEKVIEIIKTEFVNMRATFLKMSGTWKTCTVKHDDIQRNPHDSDEIILKGGIGWQYNKSGITYYNNITSGFFWTYRQLEYTAKFKEILQKFVITLLDLRMQPCA